jgi:hypothetical protein
MHRLHGLPRRRTRRTWPRALSTRTNGRSITWSACRAGSTESTGKGRALVWDSESVWSMRFS